VPRCFHPGRFLSRPIAALLHRDAGDRQAPAAQPLADAGVVADDQALCLALAMAAIGMLIPTTAGATNFETCSDSGFAHVCIIAQGDGSGYNAQVVYEGSKPLCTMLDFNLYSSNFNERIGDAGQFPACQGDGFHSYFFAVGNLGCARVEVYERQAPWRNQHTAFMAPGGPCP
jgi:hypothetical protein